MPTPLARPEIIQLRLLRRTAVLVLLLDRLGRPAPAPEVAALLDLSPSTTRAYLRSLAALGYAEQTSSGWALAAGERPALPGEASLLRLLEGASAAPPGETGQDPYAGPQAGPPAATPAESLSELHAESPVGQAAGPAEGPQAVNKIIIINPDQFDQDLIRNNKINNQPPNQHPAPAPAETRPPALPLCSPRAGRALAGGLRDPGPGRDWENLRAFMTRRAGPWQDGENLPVPTTCGAGPQGEAQPALPAGELPQAATAALAAPGAARVDLAQPSPGAGRKAAGLLPLDPAAQDALVAAQRYPSSAHGAPWGFREAPAADSAASLASLATPCVALPGLQEAPKLAGPLPQAPAAARPPSFAAPQAASQAACALLEPPAAAQQTPVTVPGARCAPRPAAGPATQAACAHLEAPAAPGQAAPGAPGAAPILQEDLLVLQADLLVLQAAPLAVQGAAPAAREAVRAIQGDVPEIQGDVPEIQGDAPETQGTCPAARQAGNAAPGAAPAARADPAQGKKGETIPAAILEAFAEVGIALNRRTRLLAARPWITPEYIHAHAQALERRGKGGETGLLIVLLERGGLAPKTGPADPDDNRRYITGKYAAYIRH